ncbi:MAG: branched-chain amino acid ABC transporter permease, partial [Gaiellaceae bacterium]
MRFNLRLRERGWRLVWRGLEGAGLERPRERWRRQRRLVQRAVPVLALALVALPLGWAFWARPSPAFLVVAATAFALYVMPASARRYVVPAAAILGAVAYPFYLDQLFELPIFGPFPSMDTVVVMAIFAVMALGLNVVVGYAGLLDLGYVAFYAIGAYTAAWFASAQFAGQNPDGSFKRNITFGAIDVPEGIGGFHINLWLLLVVAGIVTAIIGVLIGLPTLRLRGDYLAIVTLGFGEIMPQVARNGDNLFGSGFNLTNGPQGINPIDTPGFGHTLSDATGGFLPANYLSCCSADFLNHPITSTELFFWTALLLVLVTVFCSWRLRDSR